MLIPGSAQTIMSWGPHVKALSKWRRVIIPEYRCQGLITSLKPEFSSMSQLVKVSGLAHVQGMIYTNS